MFLQISSHSGLGYGQLINLSMLWESDQSCRPIFRKIYFSSFKLNFGFSASERQIIVANF